MQRPPKVKRLFKYSNIIKKIFNMTIYTNIFDICFGQMVLQIYIWYRFGEYLAIFDIYLNVIESYDMNTNIFSTW
jgi:hypothetical protein